MNVDYTGESSLVFVIGGVTITISSFLLLKYVVAFLTICLIIICIFNPIVMQSLSEALFYFGQQVKTGIDGLINTIYQTFTLEKNSFASVITDIMNRARSNKPNNKQHKHHIAPQKIVLRVFDESNSVSQVYANYYLIKSGIDINDPVNVVKLDAAFHSALNTNKYYSLIYNSTEHAYEMGGKFGVYGIILFYHILLACLNEIY